MSQQIWVLRPRDDRPGKGDRSTDPWSPWYDKNFGFVIRAASEQEAREIASDERGCEPGEAWLDDRLSECVPIDEYGGENEVLMSDFARA